ncbi:MAG: hypothetical protein Ta2A_03610 [Treponemataceae bacterium]|nr:MAG: hypothetical protein Ta2A_03610 [Treponemataceae bacterium]
MADVNHVLLIGRLTRDAELKYTTTGYPISNFSLAVNRRRKEGEQWVEEASFFDINLFGKSAEALKQYLIKGKQIAVEGELRQDRWEQDGQSRSKVVVVANNVQLLGGGAGSIGGGASGSYSGGGAGGGGYSGGTGAPSASPPASGGYRQQAVPESPPYIPDSFSEDVPF